jgi:plastocyanin
MDFSSRWMLLLGLAAAVTPGLRAQTVVRVHLVQAGPEVFRFDPSRITARPGDAIEFSVTSGGPYVVGFEPQDLTGAARERLQAAIPEPSAPLRGPVLAGPGAHFRVILPELPKGKYRFASLTHLAYRMTGVLTVP